MLTLAPAAFKVMLFPAGVGVAPGVDVGVGVGVLAVATSMPLSTAMPLTSKSPVTALMVPAPSMVCTPLKSAWSSNNVTSDPSIICFTFCISTLEKSITTAPPSLVISKVEVPSPNKVFKPPLSIKSLSCVAVNLIVLCTSMRVMFLSVLVVKSTSP